LNNLPKYVVSTTLETAEWHNSHLTKENIAEEVIGLKQQPGQNILVHGSRTLVQTLMLHQLIDEYNLLVYPLILGSAMRLFRDGSNATLKLVETKPIGADVVMLTYQSTHTIGGSHG